jgi:RNA polymerase sigma factor (sigma-70 family)
MKESLPDDESQSSFEDIMDRYGNFLHNTIARLCPKDLGLQFNDIEQEARLRLWRALESEREIASVGSYTYRIAVSVTINAIHRIKSRREEQLDLVGQGDEPGTGLHSQIADEAESPESLLERKELIQKIEHALSRLGENRQLAVGLYLKGMTTEEIGELMGWSEPKARNLAYRGLKDLREELRAEGIDYEG